MNIQSNGMGTQSIAMYIMSCEGLLPKFDYSIFADPGAELDSTYSWCKFLSDNYEIPIIHDKSKNLYQDIKHKWRTERIASIPLFTESGGMIYRQCTNDYKIAVVNKNIRNLTKSKVNLFIGISYDEIDRVFKPTTNKFEYHYPFCNLIVTKNSIKFGNYNKLTRGELKKYLSLKFDKLPEKSSCVFCPFHSNSAWRKIKEDKKAWEIALEIDDIIRNKPNIKDQLFLHRDRVPLKFAYLQEDQHEINFDCYGFCDI